MRSNGGKARKEKLSADELSAIGRAGGIASRAALSPAERSTAARRAVTARWDAVRDAAKKQRGKRRAGK